METIYISLLNEGTAAWTPVQALPLENDIFEIPIETKIPEGEEWEFRPGIKVKCRIHSFSDGSSGLIAYAIA